MSVNAVHYTHVKSVIPSHSFKRVSCPSGEWIDENAPTNEKKTLSKTHIGC